MMQQHSLLKNLPPLDRQTDGLLDRQTDRQTARKMTARNNGQTHRKIKVDGRREMRMNKLCYQLHTTLWLL